MMRRMCRQHTQKHARRDDEWGMGRSPGRGRERLFEAGALRLVILHLLQERPRHGYEIIKAIQELTGGTYSPSPGVIYPSLTLLEEMGQVVISEQAGKKQYTLTTAGIQALTDQEEAIQRILHKLQGIGSKADARRLPELQRPMQNLKMALQLRLEKGDITPDILHKIVDALDQATITIERS
ncbi:PadR family transcriptional regulator [uncultured Thiothrix sp.]|uniref:PadR family transcriptional regulator n=1 Tax=uncultured Thiothrix sp. TaxID=223185 RepID=UPI0026248C0A|nr:PadR family transcriptional regulator [uncultured Thiothrix sp.]